MGNDGDLQYLLDERLINEELDGAKLTQVDGNEYRQPIVPQTVQ